MSMVSISLFSFNNFMVGVIFRLYGITYLNTLQVSSYTEVTKTLQERTAGGTDGLNINLIVAPWSQHGRMESVLLTECQHLYLSAPGSQFIIHLSL